MKLSYALLCDNAFLSIDRKVNIIGVFETINSQKFPVIHPKFVIVGSITPNKREFKMSINIVDKKSGTTLLGDVHDREVKLPDEKAQNFNFIVEVINTNFSAPGEYTVQINIDGDLLGEVPLKIVENKLPAATKPS